MRIFGGEQIKGLMDRLALPEDQPIENALVSRAIEQAQVKVEGFHFDIRKRLVEFDDVANQQREIVYKLRRRILDSKDLKEEVMGKMEAQIDKLISLSWPEYESKPDFEKLIALFIEIIPFDKDSINRVRTELTKREDREGIRELLIKVMDDTYQLREKQFGEEILRQVEKFAYLGSIDHLWIDHIDHIDDLREGVSLRAYGQRDPLVEFKNEAYSMFETLVDRIDEELARRLFRIGVARPQPEIPLEMARTNVDKSDSTGLISESADEVAKKGAPAFSKASVSSTNGAGGENVENSGKKLGRNDPCWCGSGKKFKKCHYPQLNP